MKKKYYYDCWIQALYMMREFDVEFYTTGYLDIESDFLEKELGFHLNIKDIYYKLANDNTKIYVKPESEHIFEPKNDDFGIVKNFNPLIFVRFCSYYNSWGYEGDEYEERFNNDEVNIIYRDAKHFFNPKEEN